MERVGWSRGRVEWAIDRYSLMPGQACSYMLGMLEILDLRALVEDRLGDAFDEYAFHELILGNGSLPLGVLRGHVEAYLATGEGS
jgi:uncharacterized protein (DUF885 family)